ncbi:MAG: sugar phosphate isomerase family [Armatimonadota bacterium]
MNEFTWSPSACIPFQDVEAVDRVRKIKIEDLTRHPNPDFRIEIVPDAEFEFRWLMDMFQRIKASADEERNVTLIVPQPYTGYRKLAYLINKFKINCRHLHTFNMDEYANQDGVIAPETWKPGFMYSMLNNFYANVDEDLRPPLEQIHGLNNANIDCYGEMLEDMGGADCCYSGPGWTGHLAFIEPDAPEFAGDLEEWKKMGPRIATLSPFTIAQNSLHGSVGMSGDLWAVPPKAATIGPAQVIGAKHRIDMHAITIDGSYASWQRIITRLCLHGPVTPSIPQSILQTLRTDCWVSESSAHDIEPLWEKGY